MDPWIDQVIQKVCKRTGLNYSDAVQRALLSKLKPEDLYKHMARHHSQQMYHYMALCSDIKETQAEISNAEAEDPLILLEDDQMD